MIYGNVNNEFFEQQAAVLPKPLCEALHYLKGEDLAGHEKGVFPVEIGGVPMILQVLDLKTCPRDTLAPEIHRKYIDLQFFVCGGTEVSTCFIDDGAETVREDLLGTPRDILFYESRPETAEKENCLIMEPGAYAVYFPWDVHIPGQCDKEGPKDYRKIVLKIPMDACL